MDEEAQIRKRLDALNRRVEQLRQRLASLSTDADQQSANSLAIKIRIERSHQQRRPYRFIASGDLCFQHDMSIIRTAVFLTLLLDFKQRVEVGFGFSDPRRLIGEAYLALEPTGAKDLYNLVRISLYRFADYSETDLTLFGPKISLKFSTQDCCLHCLPSRSPGELKISIKSNVEEIGAIINRTVGASPLVRLRRETATYIPAGPTGVDQFLLELFEHERAIAMHGLFFRPSLHTFPLELLRDIGASATRLKRLETVIEGLSSGRVELLEIVNRQTLWNLIAMTEEGKFLYYPAFVKARQVADHLVYLINLLSVEKNYKLLITDAALPFHMTTFALGSGTKREFYSMVMRRYQREFAHEDSCLAIAGHPVYQGLTESVVNVVTREESTSADSSDTIALLRLICDHLLLRGALQAAADSVA